MSPLLATQITDRLAAIAEGITTANGYPSALGEHVIIAPLYTTPDSAPACVIVPGRQRVAYRYSLIETERDYEIKGFIDWRDHTGETEHALVDQVIHDLRTAFAAPDATLAGLTERIVLADDEPGYSEEGGTLIGALLRLSVHTRINPLDPSNNL